MGEAGGGRLEGFPATIEIPVQWGDMDAYGHVNNTVYFRYFESARIEYLDLCGFLESFESRGVGAILHSTSCRFRRALTYPDSVLVGGRAAEVAEDRFVMEYRIVSVDQEALVAEGDGVVVSFDYEQGTKTALPEDVRRRIEALEEGGGS